MATPYYQAGYRPAVVQIELNIIPIDGEDICRLPPFPLNEETDTHTGRMRKTGSNRCGALGILRNRICLECLKVPSRSKDHFELGRGTRTFNETVSCVVCPSSPYCSRCIGLNTGCVEIPAGFDNEVRTMLARFPEYNRLVMKPAIQRTDAETQVLRTIREDCRALYKIIKSEIKSQRVNEVAATMAEINKAKQLFEASQNTCQQTLEECSETLRAIVRTHEVVEQCLAATENFTLATYDNSENPRNRLQDDTM